MKTKARVWTSAASIPGAGTCCFDALCAGHSEGQSDHRRALMSPSFRVCCHFAVEEIAPLKNQELPQGPSIDS